MALFFALLFLLLPLLAHAEDPVTAEQVQTDANYLWTLIAAFMVFLMQAGFAMVESGFTHSTRHIT